MCKRPNGIPLTTLDVYIWWTPLRDCTHTKPTEAICCTYCSCQECLSHYTNCRDYRMFVYYTAGDLLSLWIFSFVLFETGAAGLQPHTHISRPRHSSAFLGKHSQPLNHLHRQLQGRGVSLFRDNVNQGCRLERRLPGNNWRTEHEKHGVTPLKCNVVTTEPGWSSYYYRKERGINFLIPYLHNYFETQRFTLQNT